MPSCSPHPPHPQAPQVDRGRDPQGPLPEPRPDEEQPVGGEGQVCHPVRPPHPRLTPPCEEDDSVKSVTFIKSFQGGTCFCTFSRREKATPRHPVCIWGRLVWLQGVRCGSRVSGTTPECPAWTGGGGWGSSTAPMVSSIDPGDVKCGSEYLAQPRVAAWILGAWRGPGYSRSLMYRLRRTALETPSLKRNQTSLLPTAVPMRCSAVSVSGAACSAGATRSFLHPTLTPAPQLPPPPHTPVLGAAALLTTTRPKKSLSG